MHSKSSYTCVNDRDFSEFHACLRMLHDKVATPSDVLLLLLFLWERCSRTCVSDCGFNAFPAFFRLLQREVTEPCRYYEYVDRYGNLSQINISLTNKFAY